MKKNFGYGEWSRKTVRLAVISIIGLVIGLAALATGMFLIEKAPALFFAAIAFVCVWAGLMWLFMSRRVKEEKRMRAAALTEPPHSIKHPLAKKIFAQYGYDRLADFTQYISFRGWKLKEIAEDDCIIDMVFTRKEHEVSVSIGDGETSIVIDGGGEAEEQIWIDMDEYSEPLQLWNRITLECRNAVRNR